MNFHPAVVFMWATGAVLCISGRLGTWDWVSMFATCVGTLLMFFTCTIFIIRASNGVR